MKTLFISVLTFLAQDSIAQLSGGIRVGGNIANAEFITTGVALKPNYKGGILTGGYLTLMVSKKIGFHGELVYSSQGFRMDIDNGVEWTQRLDYINVPVLFRYNVNDVINLQLGPQLSFLVGAKSTFDDIRGDAKDSLKPIDFGGVASIGFDTKSNVNGGVRYYLGMIDIVKSDNQEDFFYSDVALRNAVIQVYLGFRLFGNLR